MFASLQGQHNLPMQILDKNVPSSTQPDDDHEEQRSKRDSCAVKRKSKSKSFNPTKKLSGPKTAHLDENEHCKDEQLTFLWKKTDTEVVVAVLPTQIKNCTIIVHHSELRSLRPHEWLTGEIIEGLFHVAAHTLNLASNTVYLLNHYTAGVILFGDRSELPRQSLPKVNFDDYNAVLSFVLVNKNHWNLLYIHAQTSTVFLMDPAPQTSELVNSKHAARRLQEYFKMRSTRHGRTDWLDVKWKGGVMCHPFQQDGNSCGVIVVKMGKALMEAFPHLPKLTFGTSKNEMKRERRDLALQILDASVFDEHRYCAMCAALRPPGSEPLKANWVQCDNCYRWFHAPCVSLDSKAFVKARKGNWKCPLCV